MSPQTKKRAFTFTITTAAIGAALLAAFSWGMPSARAVASVINQHWVVADTFKDYRAEARRKADRDSINFLNALKDLRSHSDSVARELKVCIRHPEDCR